MAILVSADDDEAGKITINNDDDKNNSKIKMTMIP